MPSMHPFTAGYVAGARYVIDIIKRAADKHPHPSVRRSLTSLHTALEEGLKQWLTDLETEGSISPNSSTPQ